MQRKIIGVTKLSPNYENWLRKLDGGVELVDLYYLSVQEALDKVKSADGILLTGGSDIHPSSYGRNEDLCYCRNIDEKRDEMEFAVIDLAMREKIPLLGICRGQQILNVAKKGTLYADIQCLSEARTKHSAKDDVYHSVEIREDSQLYRLTGIRSGEVNSAHHQAVDVIGSGFYAAAYSPDKIVEAIETDDKDQSFCMAVQWHPERMDFENPLSGLLGKGFIRAMDR